MGTRSIRPGPLVRRVPLPAQTARVERVFVNGVPLREGADYEVRPDHVLLRRGVRPARPLGARGLAQVALCVEVVPGGDSVDIVAVRRDGRLTSVRLGGDTL